MIPRFRSTAPLPHRVGLEIRLSSIPSNNAVYTFNPVTNAPINESGREIVDNDTCNKCHDNLAFHGGARIDLQYCAMCHESYSIDAQSGNTVDLKVMIHKIHSGAQLPSVEAGGFYGIFGNGNKFYDFSDVVFPQDKRNCTTCHEESDADTPQATNWRVTVNRAVCSSCHDNVNFDTGENHANGVAATDDTCTTCHGPNSSLAHLRVSDAHVIPEQVAATKFQYEVLNIANSAPGQMPTVTIRVLRSDQQQHALRHQGRERPVPEFLGVPGRRRARFRRSLISPTRVANRRHRRRARRHNRSRSISR